MAKNIKRVNDARQEAVALHHRNLSTEEIGIRMTHMSTLIAMFEAQCARAGRIIREASDDIGTCDKMISELRADVATLDGLIASRRS